MSKVDYKSRKHLDDLYETLSVFIPSRISPETKLAKKRDELIHRSFLKSCKHNPKMTVFDLQLVGCKNVNAIIESHILGSNEVVLPHFIQEYGALKATLELLNMEYKPLFQFHEVSEFIPKFDIKKIKSWLYDDLTQLVEEYDIPNIDVKELVKTI